MVAGWRMSKYDSKVQSCRIRGSMLMSKMTGRTLGGGGGCHPGGAKNGESV